MFCITSSPMKTFSLLAVACLGLVGCGSDSDGGGTPIDASGSGSGTPEDAAPMIDAMADAPASQPGSPATVNCGMDACERASEVCCVTGFPNITTECMAAASCMSPKVPGLCDGPEDCAAGEICCGGANGSSCVDANACTGGSSAAVCHTAADCAAGKICRASQFSPWPICLNN